MKFAHLADCHIGSWRDPKLNNISMEAFIRAADICIEKNVDFILIAGDLFNTSLPGIDKLKETTKKLKELKDKNIPVYVIAGSHDFSPSGKTMLDVLENAGLCINVAKGETVDNKLRLNFTIDQKTGAKITGLLGKRGGLEKGYYEELVRDNLEQEQGFKIFMFHSILSEFKPDDLEKADSQPLSLLPKNFSYYAGGHPHFVFQKQEENYGIIAYPGPLFPNSFKELEKLQRGGFYIYEDGTLHHEIIQAYNVENLRINADHKTPEQVEEEIKQNITNKEFNNTIITIRVEGTLEAGKPSDINFKDIFDILYGKSAYFVMKNTNSLLSKEFEEIKVSAADVEEIEEKLIKEHLNKINIQNPDEEKIIKNFIEILSKDRLEGEKVADFEKRIKEEIENVI